MWRDLKIMLWKEARQATSTKELIPMVILPAYLGIIMPISFLSVPKGELPIDIGWFMVILMTLMLCFIGSISSSVLVAYSFAGERENNTLPTLLSTRLSDFVLVMGKALFAFLVSIAMNLLTVIFFLGSTAVMTNDFAGALKPFSSLVPILMPIVIPVLFAFLSISVGMLISTKIVNAKTASGVAFLPELPIIALVAYMLFANPFNLTRGLNFVIISLFLICLSVFFISVTVGFFSRERMIAR
jgi:ABC-type transport system involved in multi-copper enzyme maturation permease subunit